MITCVDNIMIPIFSGIGISLAVVGLMYLLALLFEVQMSAKSFVYSIALFIVMLWQSMGFVSGCSVYRDISDTEDQIEEQIPGGIEKVTDGEAKSYLLQLHPNISDLTDKADEIHEYGTASAEAYLDWLQDNVRTYMFKKTGYFFGFLLFFGVLAFLFAERRMNYNDRKRQRRSGISAARQQRTTSRYRTRKQ